MGNLEYSTSMFLGQTTGGLEMPVFFDTHTPIFNNKPPGHLITGAPGSGKTFLALSITAMSAILGKTTVVLDPKGDFIPLYGLRDQIGEFNLWNLADPRRKGILDPFSMAETSGEKLSLTITLIELFTGGLNGAQLTALAPIVKDVIKSPNPSLTAVTMALRSSTNPEARNLGTELDLISKLNFAYLCFLPSDRKTKNVEINRGLTVITLLGLDLPPSAEAASKDNRGRLATGILFLLTDFIRRIMKNDDSPNPKCLVIDEAWAVCATEAGAQTIKEVALLGRSKKLALVLVTQMASHLASLDIDNTITTRFAFRSTTKDAIGTVTDMDLPKNEGFESVITGLNTGECLMQDWREKYCTVQISNWRSDWNIAFETNPLAKSRQKAASEKQAS